MNTAVTLAGVGALAAFAAICKWVFRIRLITVRGESMSPALHEGDIVVVVSPAIAGLSQGSIVVFRPVPGGDRLFIKRVVQVPPGVENSSVAQGRSIWLMGDGRTVTGIPVIYGPIKPRDVVGTVCLVFRGPPPRAGKLADRLASEFNRVARIRSLNGPLTLVSARGEPFGALDGDQRKPDARPSGTNSEGPHPCRCRRR
jgi:hypothetical protein